MLDPDRRHLLAYVAAAAILIVVAVHYFGRGRGPEPVPSISMPALAPANAARTRPRATAPPRPPQLIWVDVAGAVRRPGLYSLPKGARVAAAITRAGGVRARANQSAVNLAAPLADGQQIFVPVGREAPAAAAGPTTGGSAVGATSGAATTGVPGARISLSTATEAELEQLDGIGPALAQRIIEYRQQHNGFHSIDELQEVSGIGAKRFAALRDSISP